MPLQPRSSSHSLVQLGKVSLSYFLYFPDDLSSVLQQPGSTLYRSELSELWPPPSPFANATGALATLAASAATTTTHALPYYHMRCREHMCKKRDRWLVRMCGSTNSKGVCVGGTAKCTIRMVYTGARSRALISSFVRQQNPNATPKPQASTEKCKRG